MSVRTALRTCPLCEATCGLEVTVDAGDVLSVRGDREDVFSHGYICPKAVGVAALQRDPDRVRTPLVRRDGRLEPAGWDEAYAEVDRLLGGVVAAHGRDALAVYLGNPNAHGIAGAFHLPHMVRGAGSRNVFSASTLDQMPKQVSAGLMFGTPLTVPVPDVDRTDHLLVLGANPLESNGSLMTAPDMRGRLRRLRARGGRLVVVDPRRSRTAEEADEHVAIRPGTDAHLLAAMAHTLYAEGLVAPGRLAAHLSGVEEVGAALAPFTPDAVAPGLPGRGRDDPPARPRPRRRAAGAVYGRIGTCTQEFGTWRAGSSTCSTRSPATSTARAGRCSPPPRRARGTPSACPHAAAAADPGAGRAGCAASPRRSASCPPPASPRRSTPPARARSAPW